MDESARTEIRAALERERERLLGEIDALESAVRVQLSDASGENNYRDHMADQGTAAFEREMDFMLVDDVREHLASVDAALGRLDDGTYGVCARCGEAIPDSRLEAMPEADLCIPCKQREESR